MAGIKQIHVYFVIILLTEILHEATSETESTTKKETEESLDEAESNGKLEIIKRIKKINEDGSYTIGYEADDGSFKIESRDVLGHIKGTYGFVDDEGQIKRVSYSTTNASEIITKPELSTVVQRIPTKKPTASYIFTSTQSTPTTTSNSVIQSIAKRRTTTSTSSTSSTTDKPNYQNIVNVSRVTQPNSVVYSSAAPRVLLQGRSSLPTIPATLKAEAQQVVSIRPSEEPFYRRLANLEDDKPASEEPRGNLLRRQLPQQQGNPEYNVREHIFSLQQSVGHDATDVYSSSMTTGTPRPLFTTTNRPLPIHLSTTSVPTTVQRPSSPYPVNYHNNYLREEQTQAQYNQPSTTSQPEPIHASPTTVPVAQIPPNRAEHQEPLVAVRQPNQRTVLVPLSHLQGRIIPYEHLNDPRGYQYVPEDTKQMVVEIEQQQAIVRKLPQHPLRPMPVQVDEHGYIRELPRQVPTPYPVPVPASPVHRYLDSDIDNDIENIQPPVSTKDFQKLLHMLIQRQGRLEKISALTRQAEVFMQPRPVYQQEPYFVQKVRPDPPHQRQNYVEVEQQHLVPLRSHPQQQLYEEQYDPQSYRPNRRVARLLPSRALEVQEEYLPSDVREMLLLRMLQLAINPAMPVAEDDIEVVTRGPTVKRTPVRNVEILGEERSNGDADGSGRTKRFEQSQDSYYFNDISE
ncbi:unnamed protein product [Phaedon cochleariae]|nr:unnamed protein product [Phaedon cochleariae]